MKKSKLYTVALAIIKPVVRLIYRVTIIGEDNIPKSGRVIICPNHTSLMDPVLLGISTNRQIFFMGKGELFKNKLVAWFLLRVGTFPVIRGKGDQTAINTAKGILRKGNVLGLFIEGTRSKTGELLKPKTGVAVIAFDTYSKIVPVRIKSEKSNRVKAFKKNFVIIGKPLNLDDLGISEGTGKEFRDASRMVMEHIKSLEDQS